MKEKKNIEKRREPKVYSMNCNIPDSRMTDEQVDMVIRLMEEAAKTGHRIDQIIFS